TDPCQSLPAGDQQVEQDRAPHVLPHHPELARPAFGESRSHYQPDCKHHNTSRLANPRGTGSRHLPCWHQGHWQPIRRITSQVGKVPRRLELCALAVTLQELIMLFSRDAIVVAWFMRPTEYCDGGQLRI